MFQYTVVRLHISGEGEIKCVKVNCDESHEGSNEVVRKLGTLRENIQCGRAWR
jgi:hypothetical protein